MSSNTTDCTICTDPLEGQCSVTQCGHIFHASCLKTWFDHKAECPLCKTKPTSRLSGFVRELQKPPAGLAVPDEPLEPPSPQAEAKLRHALSRAVQAEGLARTEQADVERRTTLKRTRIDGLQATLLEAKRQLRAAQHKEQKQKAALQNMALDDSVAASLWEAIEGRGADSGTQSAPPPPLAGLAGREAVLRQSKQLRWRCHELQALEEKVRSLRAEVSRAGADAGRL